MKHWPRLAASTLALVWVMVGVPGCSHEQDQERENLRPFVKVTGGPREGTRASYKTRIYWSGWDDDGVIAHYEYAIDPPPAFSFEEISSPETSDGVTTRHIPAFTSDAPDTIRVEKLEGGATISFDYIRTPYSDHTFALESSEADSLYIDGKKSPWLTASGAHRVYVRAVDNEGGISRADNLGFTAWTYTPTSWLEFPETGRGLLHMGQKIILEWNGRDPDPPNRVREKPVGYLYKLVNLKELTPPMGIIYVNDPQAVAFDKAKDVPWTYIDAETTSMVMHVDPGEYLFAIRAVDVVGGVEPFVQWGQGAEAGNSFLFTVALGGGMPDLVVTEPFLGTFPFRGTGKVFDVEVPVGTPLRFTWTATAEEYGGRIESFSYGMDIADLEAEGPGSGWTPWGQTTSSEPFTFHEPGIHVFYARVKDSNENVTIGSVAMRFFDLPFDREVLFVDDYLNKVLPLDREHDAFWKETFRNSDRFTSADLRPEDSWYETGGEGDAGFLLPQAPPLSFLGRYKLLVWNVHGAGYCGRTGFLTAATMTPHLRAYMAAGGKMWVTGKMTLASTLRGTDCPDPDGPFYRPSDGPPMPAAETAYPHAYLSGDFAFDVLKLATPRAENGKGFEWYDSLVRVDAWDPVSPVFQSMDVDPMKLGELLWENDALTHADAIFEPIYTGDISGFRGKIDSLYAYAAAGQERRPWDDRNSSAFDKRLCATRWHDPDPARAQGRVMWFGFPLYYMMGNQAQDTFNKAIDWFMEEERPKEEDDQALGAFSRGALEVRPGWVQN